MLCSIPDNRTHRPAFLHSQAMRRWRSQAETRDLYTSSICAKIDQAFGQASIRYQMRNCQRHKTKIRQPLQQTQQTVLPDQGHTHSRNSPNKHHPEKRKKKICLFFVVVTVAVFVLFRKGNGWWRENQFNRMFCCRFI